MPRKTLRLKRTQLMAPDLMRVDLTRPVEMEQAHAKQPP
jgi:hypothetical protein